MNKLKIVITTAISIVLSWLGVLAIPVLLMVTCNLIDYITGLMASKYREQSISSYRSMKGIFKKVCMWLLVVVGAIIDELLMIATAQLGVELKLTALIASIVCMWIICNEIISILENIQDIGAPIPGFLMPLARRIKATTEASGEALLSDVAEELGIDTKKKHTKHRKKHKQLVLPEGTIIEEERHPEEDDVQIEESQKQEEDPVETEESQMPQEDPAGIEDDQTPSVEITEKEEIQLTAEAMATENDEQENAFVQESEEYERSDKTSSHSTI